MNVIEKPWGKEEILEVNNKYVVKRLTMNHGCKCSLQYHNEKKETIYVLEGVLSITIDGIIHDYVEGMVVTIEPGQVHRMEARYGVKNAVYLECSTPQLDDVIRLEDDYNRV